MDNQPYHNIRALIVEDGAVQRKILWSMLNKKVAELSTAEDGEKGLEQFEKYKPNLVIADINMPKMNGIEMLKKIKEIDKNIAIIVLSSEENKEVIIDAVNIGVNKFLPRPIDKELFDNFLQGLNSHYEEKKRSKKEHLLLTQYKKIIDKTMLVTKTDPYGNITFVNRNFAKISGYSVPELIGHNHNIIRHEDMPNKVFKDLWDTIKNKETWKGTVKNKKKDGGFYVVNATIIPILDDNGNIAEYISIREEITNQYLQKEKEKLEKERDQLEKVAKAKESFLVVFTHELKTPLNAIISFSQYVFKKLSRTDVRGREEFLELLSEVTENAKDMLYNINNILEISRLKESKLSFNKKEFILEDLIRGIDKQFSGLILKNNIDISYELPNTTKLYCDEQRVKQILSNLISNGIKYGNKVIQVTVISDHKRFTIDVEDNGGGIKNKEIIFGLFEQEEDDNMTRTATGTGVGLFFLKKLCESFGYKIEVLDSKRLGGAHFRVSGELICKGNEDV